MMTWSERMRSEGREQGILLGLEQGIEKGMEKVSSKASLPSSPGRFGPLDAATSERLQKATSAEQERWADNILELEEVFGAE